MRKKAAILAVFILASGSLLAQNSVKEVENETQLTNAKINADIRFNNKAKSDVEIYGLTSLAHFGFEGNFLKPEKPKELTVEKCDFYNSDFLGPYFETLTFDTCHFQKAPVFKSRIDSIDTYIVGADFRDCTFSDGLDLSSTTFGDNGLSIAGEMNGQLDLSNLVVKNPLTVIDLLKLYPGHYSGDKTDTTSKIEIDLTGAPIANILMNYKYFKLEPNSLEDEPNATSIYTCLLANFKAHGFDESYELADIEFRKYKAHHSQSVLGKIFLPIIDRFQEVWWKYGYDRFRILIITPILLIIFTIINLFLYKSMNKLVYTVDNDDIATQEVSFFNSLVYTSIVFFSFSLNLDKLHFKNRALSIWLVFIYLFGVICMGFLANYVLRSGGVN